MSGSGDNAGSEVGPPPLLRMRGVHKRFPGIHAVRGVDLSLDRGEVLALLGENGAGKSTLIKALGGAHILDAGSIEIDGEAVRIDRPRDARRLGISVIYQDFNLVPAMTARENVFLGDPSSVGGFVRAAAERRRAAALFDRVGVPVDPETPCRHLSVAEQQLVEIAKALAHEATILVMDEPSATLTPEEVRRLFRIIGELRAQGHGIIYISHRLCEVFEIADRVTVLRDGALVDDRPVPEVGRRDLIEMMVGRPLDREFPRRTPAVGPRRLAVRGLRRGDDVKDVTFDAHAGEIVALAGLVGAGRTETARLLFGADPRDAGEIELDGRPLRLRHPRDAIRAGICLLPEDRKNHGLILNQPVVENFSLPNLRAFTRVGLVRPAAERSAFDRHVKGLDMRLANPSQPAGQLSGGNQQKLVLAKWLERQAELVIFDEPTRGIDVGSRYEIYTLIHALADAGKAVLMISSELPEVLGMADRILVMHKGRITGEIADVGGATQEDVLELAIQ